MTDRDLRGRRFISDPEPGQVALDGCLQVDLASLGKLQNIQRSKRLGHRGELEWRLGSDAFAIASDEENVGALNHRHGHSRDPRLFHCLWNESMERVESLTIDLSERAQTKRGHRG
jgi:hypothetical protein